MILRIARPAPAVCALAVSFLLSEASAVEPRTLHRIGLFDAEFTASTGLQHSGFFFAADGHATGFSSRYVGTENRGQGAWIADGSTGVTHRVGFFDSAHTRSDGTQSSGVLALADGFAAGGSSKYGGSFYLGNSAWIANTATGSTIRVGFFDGAYTRLDGYQASGVLFLGGNYSAGSSQKFGFGGGTELGYAAWAANNHTGTTTRVGFFDAGHTRGDGYQDSFVKGFGDGYVVGNSNRYSGFALHGESAWVGDVATGTSTHLGFLDSAHTRDDGFQNSRVGLFTGGKAAGYSERFSGATGLGFTAWVTNLATNATTRVGLLDAAHTSSEGQQSSLVERLTSGFAAGISAKYQGSGSQGQSAWITEFATGTTHRVGLTGAGFLRNDGTEVSAVGWLVGSYAAGISTRYSGAAFAGQGAWVAHGPTGATHRVGFWGGEYQQPTGREESLVTHLMGEHAAGYSLRYSGTSNRGQAVWVSDAATGATTRVGIFDGAHTYYDGGQYSTLSFLTNDFAAGYSARYQDSTNLGETAWIYNISTHTIDSIVLSLRVSDGYAQSRILALSDSGLAVGSYTLFEAGGPYGVPRAFGWTPTDGAFDLATAIAGGLEMSQFSGLASADLITGSVFGSELIFGTGSIGNNPGAQAYVATPEPTTAGLLALGGLVFLNHRRRPTRRKGVIAALDWK